MNYHLAEQNAAAGENQKRTGLYSWERMPGLKTFTRRRGLAPVQLPADLVAQLVQELRRHILGRTERWDTFMCSSIPQANAAAVLRSGFIAAQWSGSDSGELSVNLSSDRVRIALALIEGIRSGQSLGALLGYQFELVLHDDYTTVEVDKFIYPLRTAFPLVADSLASTQTTTDVPIEAVEARNVVDGQKLVNQITSSGVPTYPWGVAGLPAATATEQTALNSAADALRDSYDAVADLALSEGVYQAVQGNYDRVGSTIAAHTTGRIFHLSQGLLMRLRRAPESRIALAFNSGRGWPRLRTQRRALKLSLQLTIGCRVCFRRSIT